MIKVDLKAVSTFLTDAQMKEYTGKALAGFDTLESGKGLGNDFLGWDHLPSEDREQIYRDIEEVCEKWKKIGVDLVVVIGIGGSYLGAKCAIEALSHTFSASLGVNKPQVVFAGNSLSQDYLCDLMDLVKQRSAAVIVISKSGTTTEPAIAFRIFKQYLEEKYGKKASRERIVAITDAHRGALKSLSEQEGYKSFVIPDNVGGRYSVLTPVGLLPIAAAGFDFRKMMQGAEDMEKICMERSAENPAIQYAAVRNALLSIGKNVEILVSFEPKLQYFGEWWKQLFGESEGKDGKGLFPASVNFTTDLHSMGQYIQDGQRIIFETVIAVKGAQRKMRINDDPQNLDGLNFLNGKEINECNLMARLGTKLAHVDGGVPNVEVDVDIIDEYTIGELFYFFEKACGISGYILGVNPFNQPGVEAYKKNMFALLDKPGYEEQAAALKKRL
jgi:glucose-6-phosphate isomerase